MIDYKITYWLSGNKRVAYIKADSVERARFWFEMTIPNDDVISIEESTNNVV